MAEVAPADRAVCVLDFESRLSEDAQALIGAKDHAGMSRSMLLEVSAVSLLRFRMTGDGLDDVSLVSAADPMCATIPRLEVVRCRWAWSPEEEAGVLGGTGFSGPVGKAASWRSATFERRVRLLVSLGDAQDALPRDEARVPAWMRRPCGMVGDQRPLQTVASLVQFVRVFRRAVKVFAW